MTGSPSSSPPGSGSPLISSRGILRRPSIFSIHAPRAMPSSRVRTRSCRWNRGKRFSSGSGSWPSFTYSSSGIRFRNELRSLTPISSSTRTRSSSMKNSAIVDAFMARVMTMASARTKLTEAHKNIRNVGSRVKRRTAFARFCLKRRIQLTADCPPRQALARAVHSLHPGRIFT